MATDDRAVIEFRVRYAETDQMRLAHHSHYVAWCEQGRTTLMRRRGVSYAELERRGVLLPVSRLEIEYRQGVGFDELVRVRTRVERVRSRSVAFSYELHGEDEVLLARARTELVCTDRTGRPTRLPDDVRVALDRTASHTADDDGVS